jgi:hypothetical protein
VCACEKVFVCVHVRKCVCVCVLVRECVEHKSKGVYMAYLSLSVSVYDGNVAACIPSSLLSLSDSHTHTHILSLTLSLCDLYSYVYRLVEFLGGLVPRDPSQDRLADTTTTLADPRFTVCALCRSVCVCIYVSE